MSSSARCPARSVSSSTASICTTNNRSRCDEPCATRGWTIRWCWSGDKTSMSTNTSGSWSGSARSARPATPRHPIARRSTSRTHATTVWPAKARCSSIRTSVSTTSLLPGLSLYAEEVPSSGGETIFASTQLAYQRLPDELKQRVGGLHARHVYDYGNDRGTQRFRIAAAPQAPTATHPVVLAHPATDRPLLFVNELMTDSDRRARRPGERRPVARAVVLPRR